MPVKVIVPNKNYNESYFGEQFVNGVAVFEDEKKGREIAERLGYQVEEIKVEKPKAPVKRKPAKKATEKKEG